MGFVSPRPTAKKGGKKKQSSASSKLQLQKELDKLAHARRTVEKLATQMLAARAVEHECEVQVMAAMRESNLKTARMTNGELANIKTKTYANIGDWESFVKFVKKTNGFDLLQRRVSTEAWRQRVEDGVKVPGIEVFTKQVLSIRNKRKGKASE
jgi:hypothetical protein